MNSQDHTARSDSGGRSIFARSGQDLNGYLERCIDNSGKKQPLAYIAVQLMRLTETTAAFGVSAREDLLTAIACAIRGALPKDAELFHIQTNMFGVVLPEATFERTPQLVQSIVRLFQQPFAVKSIPIHAEVTIGVAVYPHHASGSQQLRQATAAALVEAQRQSEPICIYDSKLHQKQSDGLALVSALRSGLQNGELELWYQPEITLPDGKQSGAEALLRWRHPRHGLLTAARFIEPAERTAIITDVTNWVLRAAAEQLTCLEDGSLHLSVNVSAKDILRHGLADMLQDLLQYHHLAPERLEIEITESALVQNPNRAAKVLNDLRDLGLSIAIDDFGAGHASLRYLADFPITTVKIDQRFVSAVLKEARCATIVDRTIELCHDLSLKVVAEGVENEDTAAWLAAHHCDAIQGYLIAKPMPRDEYVRWTAELQSKDGFQFKSRNGSPSLRLIDHR